MIKPDCQLLVIGAGPAGMAAALAAARQGVEVTVVDEQPQPGGQIYRNVDTSPLHDIALLGKDYVRGRQLVQAFRQAQIEYSANSSVWYLDESNHVGVVVDGVHRRVVAERVIIACGAQERPMPFPGWDKPGVMTAGAAQILLKSAAMVPDQPVLLAGQGPLLLLLAWQYLRAGVTIRALVDTSDEKAGRNAWRHLPRALGASEYLLKGLRMLIAIRQAGVPWYPSACDLQAEGNGCIEALSFSAAGRSHRIETPLLLLHQGVVPALHMSAAAGCSTRWSDMQQCWQPQFDDWGETTQQGLFVAGDAGAIGGARVAELDGQLAGLQVAQQLGLIGPAIRDRLAAPVRRARNRQLAIRPFLDTRYRVADAALLPIDKTLACRCEEVTVEEIRRLAKLGCNGPNQAKAFSRCGMGPCQGRFCGATMERVFASERGAGSQQVGHFNVRPPLKPVTLGQLADSEEA